MLRERYSYKWIDFEKWIDPRTRKQSKSIRHTYGRFVGWSEPMGLPNVPYAIFQNKRSEVLVPEYDVTEETLRKIGMPPTRKQS